MTVRFLGDDDWLVQEMLAHDDGRRPPAHVPRIWDQALKGADFCQWITYPRTARSADEKTNYGAFAKGRGWFVAATAAWLELELANATTLYQVSRAMAKALMVLCIIPRATAHHASAVCHYVLQRRGMLKSASETGLDTTTSCADEPIMEPVEPQSAEANSQQ